MIAASVAGACALVLLGGGPAFAKFDDNTVGCAGSAVITGDDAKTYPVNATDAVAKVPRTGTAKWEGSLGTVTHNHSGEVSLEVGPSAIVLGSWGPSKNDKDENKRSGTRKLPDALGGLPPGRYVVSGFHQGDEGRCSGWVELEVQGNPLTSPAGAGAAVGTVVTGGLLALAARPKAGAVA